MCVTPPPLGPFLKGGEKRAAVRMGATMSGRTIITTELIVRATSDSPQ